MNKQETTKNDGAANATKNESNYSTRSQSHADGSQSNKQRRLRNTNQEFENNNNGYATFLGDKGELPRLSILDNYK